LVPRGEHQFQQPEFIEATSERLSDLAERGEHPWQQPEFIEATSEQMRTLVARGEHQFQQPEFIEATSERLSDLAERGEHHFQQPELIEANSERMRALVARGEHHFQQPELIEANSERMRALVARGEHHFQQPEFIEANSERLRKGIHNKRKLSSGSTEEATYYAIDGADENGRYILIHGIFGTKDINFRKKIERRNGKRSMTQFHTREAINELYLRKCSTKTCTNRKICSNMFCQSCLGYK
jgi:hypothetical protein